MTTQDIIEADADLLKVRNTLKVLQEKIAAARDVLRDLRPQYQRAALLAEADPAEAAERDRLKERIDRTAAQLAELESALEGARNIEREAQARATAARREGAIAEATRALKEREMVAEELQDALLRAGRAYVRMKELGNVACEVLVPYFRKDAGVIAHHDLDVREHFRTVLHRAGCDFIEVGWFSISQLSDLPARAAEGTRRLLALVAE